MMQNFIWISLLVLILIVVGVLIAMGKSRNLAPADQDKHPKGYWMSLGISTGVGIGVALGVALENIGAGIALGVAIGAGIGASLEQKNKDNIRPMTEQEKKRQKWGVAAGLVIPLILIGFLIVLMLLRTK
jgi:hypothetical protein